MSPELTNAKALIAAATDRNYISVYNAARAIVFFGTPHRGAVALEATRVSTLIHAAGLFQVRIPGNLQESLKVRSTELFRINDQFRKISLFDGGKLSVTCFYERQTTAGLGDVVGF